MARGSRDEVQGSSVTVEAADRAWFISLFASFARERGDLDTILTRRAEREMRRRQSGLSGRGEHYCDRRFSSGRRLDDLSRVVERV
jgi:hypothetical protein